MHLQKTDLVIRQEVNLRLCLLHNPPDVPASRIFCRFYHFPDQPFCFPQIIQFISIADSQVMSLPSQCLTPILRTADDKLHLYQCGRF